MDVKPLNVDSFPGPCSLQYFKVSFNFIYSHCPLGHHDAIWLQRQLGFALIIEFAFCLFNLTFSPPALSHNQRIKYSSLVSYPTLLSLTV